MIYKNIANSLIKKSYLDISLCVEESRACNWAAAAISAKFP